MYRKWISEWGSEGVWVTVCVRVCVERERDPGNFHLSLDVDGLGLDILTPTWKASALKCTKPCPSLYFRSYGWSRARYVYSLISGVGIFFLGAGVTSYHGIMGLLHPHVLENIPVVSDWYMIDRRLCQVLIDIILISISGSVCAWSISCRWRVWV